jgi:capsid protein
LPSDKPKPNPARSFARAAFAVGKNALDHAGKRKGAHVLAEERWPMDRAALALTKAAVSPATMTNTSVLSPSITADFVASLAFDSAAAKLIDLGMRIDMSGVSSVLIPHRSTNLPDVNAQWIGETNSFPVRQYTLAASTLGPVHKLASSVVLSREMSEAAGGEEVFSTLLREDLAASLDSSMFSATAASAVRPAGLLAGVSALTATAGGGAGALQGDIAALASVASAVGSDNVVFIASSAYALRLRTYKTVLEPEEDNFQIFASIAVPDGRLIAVAPQAFVSGFGAVPRVLVSEHALVQLEDTSPAATFGTAGTPNVVSAPLRSSYQTDSVVVRAILDAAWALRSTGAVAYVDSVTW